MTVHILRIRKKNKTRTNLITKGGLVSRIEYYRTCREMQGNTEQNDRTELHISMPGCHRGAPFNRTRLPRICEVQVCVEGLHTLIFLPIDRKYRGLHIVVSSSPGSSQRSMLQHIKKRARPGTFKTTPTYSNNVLEQCSQEFPDEGADSD